MPLSTVVYTVCSVAFLGQAKAMAASLISQHPSLKFYVGVIDRIQGQINPSDYPYELIEAEHLGIPNLDRLAKKYTGLELCCLAKPYMAAYLFNRFPQTGKLLYIDTDILFFGKMEQVIAALDTYDIVLTPHMFTPYTDDAYPKETSHLNAGLYNAGFFAVRRSVNTFNFLAWWQQRLQTYGYVNFMDGMFVDQIWLNFVPLFFDNVLISKDLGLNVGYWNLHERRLTVNAAGHYLINDKFPLVFFHFSGYKPSRPDSISVHTDRYDLANRPEWRPVFETYREALTTHQNEAYLAIPNALVQPKPYLKWGKIREYALRISRKIIREWHG